MTSSVPPARTQFVGRAPEMAALASALESAATGQGGTVLLAGEPGIGKTRLAEELAAVARERGAHVLWGRCYEGEGAPAFWPWIEVLRAYVRAADAATLSEMMGTGLVDIAELVAELRPFLADTPRPEPLEPAQARFRLFDSVTSFLRQASLAEPLLIVLDDLQWADSASLQLLQFLARSVQGMPLLLVGAYRDAEVSQGHPLDLVLTTLRRERGYQHLHLSGLGPHGVLALLQAVSPADHPDGDRHATPAALGPEAGSLAQALYDLTAGNPLFVSETVRHLLETGYPRPGAAAWTGAGADRMAVGVPQGVRGVIRERLARLSAACARVLTVAAVLGREFDLPGLSAVSELSHLPLLDALDEAVNAGLLIASPEIAPRYRFAHDLIRETLYGDLGTAARVRLHGRVGEALEAIHGAEAEPHLGELAWHFARAAPGGHVDKAVTYAERAAVRATRVLADDEAAAHYELALQSLALRLPVDEQRRCELLLALAQARARAGDYAAANEAFGRAAEVAETLGKAGWHGAAAALARAAIGYGGDWLALGAVDQRHVDLLERALGALGEEDSPLRARLLARAGEAVRHADPERSRRLSEAAVVMARRCGDPATLEQVLAARWAALSDVQDRSERLALADEVLRLTESTGSRDLGVSMRLWRIEILLEAGEIAAVDAELALAGRLADDLRLPLARWRVLTLRTMRAQMSGRFAEAEALAVEAHDLGRRVVGEAADDIFRAQMLMLRGQQGRLDDREAIAGGQLERQAANPVWLCALATGHVSRGRLDEARRLFEWLAEDDFARLSGAARWTGTLSMLAEVCAALGDARRAATLYRLLAPYARGTVTAPGGIFCRGAVAHFLGRLAAAMARWDEADRHFRDALAMNARMSARPSLATTRHAYATMLLARSEAEGARGGGVDTGRLDQARELAAQALATARELGMARLAGEAEALQTQIAAMLTPETPARMPDTGFPDGLTAREVEVLRLLAAGKTNKEIADELVVSDRTVGRHIENVYGKIGARRRADAAAYALRHGLLPPEP